MAVEADLATGRRACPRTEIGLGVRGGAIIDTPNFYGNLGGQAQLFGSWAFRRKTELFATLEPVTFGFTQNATLTKPGTIQSLSFYVAQAAGNLRLGIYDASGPNGGPGAKKAETNEFVAAVGWNAVPVVTPVLLPVGDYWLAYAPSDSNLHFELAGDGTGTLVYYSNPYGPMPATFSDAPTTANDHWSFYATLSE